MARYIKQEMPDLHKTGVNKCYYRLQNEGNISTDKLVANIALHAGNCLSEGILMNAITEISQEMVRLLGDGYTVTLDGIGTFSATIGLKKGEEMDDIDSKGPKHNARKIEVKNVEYKSDKTFVKNIRRRCDLEKAGTRRVNRSPYSKNQREQLLLKYLKESGRNFITVAQYCDMTQLPKSSGAKELKAWAEDKNSQIDWEGAGSHKVYVLCQPRE